MIYIYIPRISFWIEKKPIYNKIEKHLINQIEPVMQFQANIPSNIARLIYYHPNHQEFIIQYVESWLEWNSEKAMIIDDIYADLKELENSNPKKIRLEQ